MGILFDYVMKKELQYAKGRSIKNRENQEKRIGHTAYDEGREIQRHRERAQYPKTR